MKHFLVSGAVLGVVLCGCQSHEAQLIGKWKGSSASMGGSSSNDVGANFAKAMASSMTVEFKPDKHFSMTMMIIPIEGTWSLSGSTVTMTPTKAMGMDMNQLRDAAKAQGKNVSSKDMDQPMTMNLSDDGKTLTMQGKNGQQGQMSFVKDTGT